MKETMKQTNTTSSIISLRSYFGVGLIMTGLLAGGCLSGEELNPSEEVGSVESAFGEGEGAYSYGDDTGGQGAANSGEKPNDPDDEEPDGEEETNDPDDEEPDGEEPGGEDADPKEPVCQDDVDECDADADCGPGGTCVEEEVFCSPTGSTPPSDIEEKEQKCLDDKAAALKGCNHSFCSLIDECYANVETKWNAYVALHCNSSSFFDTYNCYYRANAHVAVDTAACTALATGCGTCTAAAHTAYTVCVADAWGAGAIFSKLKKCLGF